MRKFLRHIFVPHESNKHRARALHVDSLIIASALIFFSLSLLSAVHSKFPAVLGISYQVTPAELLDLTNKIRRDNKLGTLRLDPQLSQAAAAKAADMFAKNYWAHVDPDGITPWVYIKDSGYDYLYAGENLARGYTGSADVVRAWMNSPTHRDNMLSPNYRDVGFAVATGNLKGYDTVLVVEEFGSKYDHNGDNSSDAADSAVTYNIPEVKPAVNSNTENPITCINPKTK